MLQRLAAKQHSRHEHEVMPIPTDVIANECKHDNVILPDSVPVLQKARVNLGDAITFDTEVDNFGSSALIFGQPAGEGLLIIDSKPESERVAENKNAFVCLSGWD